MLEVASGCVVLKREAGKVFRRIRREEGERSIANSFLRRLREGFLCG